MKFQAIYKIDSNKKKMRSNYMKVNNFKIKRWPNSIET